MTEYKTVLKRAEDAFVERRSRFIGHAAPVKTEEEAVAFINEMKAKYWDATHNVYAYCLRDGRSSAIPTTANPRGQRGFPPWMSCKSPASRTPSWWLRGILAACCWARAAWCAPIRMGLPLRWKLRGLSPCVNALWHRFPATITNMDGCRR